MAANFWRCRNDEFLCSQRKFNRCRIVHTLTRFEDFYSDNAAFRVIVDYVIIHYHSQQINRLTLLELRLVNFLLFKSRYDLPRARHHRFNPSLWY